MPVHEHDDVRVLLDGAGFAQVAHYRAFVGALFKAAIELRECHHRAVELACHQFQRARNFRNLAGAVFAGAFHLHQLKIVDHDHAELALLARNPASTAAHFARAEARRVVDEQRPVSEFGHRHAELVPVVVFETAVAHACLVNFAERRNHADDQAFGRHFETEHQHRFVLMQDGVLDHVHGERRFPH